MRRFFISIVCLALWCVSASAQLTEQQQIQKLNYVYQQLRNNYVDDVPLEPLVEEAIKATLKELDPHSTYLSPEQMADLRIRLRGEYAGVGIRYNMHNDTMVVRGTLENSPAGRAKIQLNDRITAIDGKSIIGVPTDSITTLLRGEADTKVSIDIVRRSEDKPLKITLSREFITSSAIGAAFRVGDVGYISISKFSKLGGSEFLQAYKELGEITSLIVDLRDNGGGAIISAIDITSLFLERGDVIVSTEGRTNSIVYDKKRDNYIDCPIVVIINENSASASEIFAGAIQDHDRGVVVGHTSFGKGLVQKVVDLKDGSGISLTIARYKTPSGRTIQRPYTMGKGDEYRTDSLRYMHPDSIPYDSELLFRTLKRGRKVYGGGGITPDVYIDTDSIQLSQRLSQLYSEAVFEHTAIEYWDGVSPKVIGKQYPTIEEFAGNFQLCDDIYNIFCRYAQCSLDDFTELDQRFIRTMLMASIAEQLYGDSARQYIYCLGFDYMMQRALEIITDTEAYERILSPAN